VSKQENANRAVLVTGGSRGLGLAIVRALLEDGYTVATCSRSRSTELDELVEQLDETRFLWTTCTVGSEPSESAAVAAFLEWLGDRTWHGLINNAGIAGEGILATYPTVDAVRIIEVNLLGALRMARHAARSMLRSRNGGRIVNVSSILGSRGYNGLAAYSASKAGMDGMTRALARELGRRRITVNSIAPGYLATDMTTTLADRQRGQIVNRTPLGRLGTVDDVVPMALFLLSEEASFITGQTLVIDGGISC
jgi:3-oxoacyl-[acyl-carrier protein] reductase